MKQIPSLHLDSIIFHPTSSDSPPSELWLRSSVFRFPILPSSVGMAPVIHKQCPVQLSDISSTNLHGVTGILSTTSIPDLQRKFAKYQWACQIAMNVFQLLYLHQTISGHSWQALRFGQLRQSTASRVCTTVHERTPWKQRAYVRCVRTKPRGRGR